MSAKPIITRPWKSSYFSPGFQMGVVVLCKTIHFPNSVLNCVGTIIQMFFEHLWSLNKNVINSFYLCSEIHSVWTLAALLCIFKMKVIPLSSKAPRSEPQPTSSSQPGGLVSSNSWCEGAFPPGCVDPQWNVSSSTQRISNLTWSIQTFEWTT